MSTLQKNIWGWPVLADLGCKAQAAGAIKLQCKNLGSGWSPGPSPPTQGLKDWPPALAPISTQQFYSPAAWALRAQVNRAGPAAVLLQCRCTCSVFDNLSYRLAIRGRIGCVRHTPWVPFSQEGIHQSIWCLQSSHSPRYDMEHEFVYWHEWYWLFYAWWPCWPLSKHYRNILHSHWLRNPTQ